MVGGAFIKSQMKYKVGFPGSKGLAFPLTLLSD